MKPVRVESAACEDLRQAFEWYEAQQAGLGHALLAQFDNTQQRIAALPASFPGSIIPSSESPRCRHRFRSFIAKPAGH